MSGGEDTVPRNIRAGAVRQSDIEPYTALRWVGTLFKSAAVFLLVAIVAEFVAGMRMEGLAALPILLGELARTAVLAVALWGGGDLVRLLIHLGHDIRAQRILLARVAYRLRHDSAPGTDDELERPSARHPEARPQRHGDEAPQRRTAPPPGPEAAAD